MFGTRIAATALAVGLIGLTGGCVPPQVEKAREQQKLDYRNVSRTIAWSGGDKLWVSVPADVRYVAGPANTVQITGPNRYVSHVVVDNGAIRYDENHFWGFFSWDWGDHQSLHIVVTTPHLSSVHVGGSGHLDLGKLEQDSLDVGVSGSGGAEATGAIKAVHASVSGSGWVKMPGVTASTFEAIISGSGYIKAQGTAESVDAGISGSGHADLAELVTQDLKAHVSGSGSINAAPKRDAEATVSGSGHVGLSTEPAHLVTHRSGSGSISHPGGSSD